MFIWQRNKVYKHSQLQFLNQAITHITRGQPHRFGPCGCNVKDISDQSKGWIDSPCLKCGYNISTPKFKVNSKI